jgi:hypothetical protein
MTVWKLLILSLFLFPASWTGMQPRAEGQYQVIVQEKVELSHSLSGFVAVQGHPSPIQGVTVAVCSPDWTKTLASTTTNATGHFSFPALQSPGLYHLRLSLSGFDPLEVRVKVSPETKHNLHLSLTVAT